MQNALAPDLMSQEERTDEVAEILARGVIRWWNRQFEEKPKEDGAETRVPHPTDPAILKIMEKMKAAGLNPADFDPDGIFQSGP